MCPTLQTVLTKNDGIVHGKFLRRTKVPGLARSNFVDVLRIGSTIEVFGRVIYLYACDPATRVRASVATRDTRH